MEEFVIIGAPLPTVFWTSSSGISAGSSPYSFPGLAIGSADSTRQVFVATYNDTATAVTVGGISATLVVSSSSLILWRAAVPSGTTADIVVTTSGSSGRELVTVLAAYNLASTTPFHTASYAAGGAASSHSTTINTASNGILIAAAAASVSPGVVVSSWGGATLRDNRALALGIFDLVLSAASSESTAAATAATLTSNWSGSQAANMVAASFL